jgi:hypothetical protein
MTYNRKLITWSDPASLEGALTFLRSTAELEVSPGPPEAAADYYSTTWYSISPLRCARHPEVNEKVCADTVTRDNTPLLGSARMADYTATVFKSLSCGDEVTHRENRSAPPGELPRFSAWDELLRLSPEELETRMAEIVRAMTPDKVTHKEVRQAPDERPLVTPAPTPEPVPQPATPVAPGR